MKGSLTTLLLTCILSCSSASSQPVFIILRDVPQSPSIVVIPSSFSKDGLQYADRIEEHLISFHIKVVQRPSIRQVTETKGASMQEAVPGEAANKGKSLTEEYIAYEETGADYILLTDEDAERVKLIRSSSREILATAGSLNDYLSGRIYNEYNEEAPKLGIEDRREYRIYRMLKSAGLPVRGPKQ